MERVEDDVESDAFGVFAGVAFAFERVVFFQGAAQVEFGEDHGPAIADPDPFQFGLDLADAAGQFAVVIRPLAECEARRSKGRSRRKRW